MSGKSFEDQIEELRAMLERNIASLQSKLDELSQTISHQENVIARVESQLASVVEAAEGYDHRLLEQMISDSKQLLIERGWRECIYCGELWYRECQTCKWGE